MSAPVDRRGEIEVGSTLEHGVWEVDINLGSTTILIETTQSDIDSLPILINAMNTILEAAWASIEQKIQEDQP